jgi:hypothetical protein
VPQLEITSAALAPEHARATQEYLMAVRVWPAADQGDRRAAFLESCAAARLIDEAKAVPATLRVEMLEQAFRAKPPEDFEPELTLRIRQGLLVGTFYAEMIVRHMAGQTITIKAMLSRFTDAAFRQLHSVTDMKRSKLESVLREYRPAATLLAAASIHHFDRTVLPRADVAEFLALSEWLRVKAASIPLLRRAETLLPPDQDLWRVPPSLTLPRVDFRLPEMMTAEWVRAVDTNRLPRDPVG